MRQFMWTCTGFVAGISVSYVFGGWDAAMYLWGLNKMGHVEITCPVGVEYQPAQFLSMDLKGLPESCSATVTHIDFTARRKPDAR